MQNFRLDFLVINPILGSVYKNLLSVAVMDRFYASLFLFLV